MSTVAPDPSRLYPAMSIHRAISSPDDVTPAHLEEFRQHGFLAVENVFTLTEIESAKEALRLLISGGIPDCVPQFERGVDVTNLSAEQREPYVRKFMGFTKHEPRLRALSEHPTLLRIVRMILGSDFTMIQDMALLKPPHVGREKPWHQDTAYFAMEPLDLILGTWTALDEATPENGCMHVIPGSHLAGPKPHYHDRDCQLPDDVVDVSRSILVPLKPGGTLFFSGLLHHGTPPNRSATRRRALQFHYASVNCRKVELTDHATHFHDAKGYAACAGWGTPQGPRPIADRTDNLA
jgi:phytanoyl-CoA hydroxylase